MREFWNERFAVENYIYGTKPNEFFSEQLSKLEQGALLLPAEGEGRNAVFAAINGWKVSAFDYSEEGKKKALELAASNNVNIDYQILQATDYHSELTYNAIALIYAHFIAQERKILFAELEKSLVPGGALIAEVFSKKQLGRKSGGPKVPELLYSLEEFKELLPELSFSILDEVEVTLDEGPLHQGEAMVIRAVGKKR